MKKQPATYQPPDFIPATEVAKLVRQSLKEAFGTSVKFRVITKWLELSQDIYVTWENPAIAVSEVKPYIGHFHGADNDPQFGTQFRKTTWRGKNVQFGNAFIRIEQQS